MTKAHPVLILGIVIFVAPFLLTIAHINLPGWVNIIGIVIILIGAVLSMFDN